METINIEEFIAEIEAQPAIWNNLHEDNNNKAAKKRAWELVVRKFTLNFDGLDAAEQYNLVARFQRKWKSLRDCFTREQKKKKEKSGSGFTIRRQYIYFDHLSFLKNLPKSTASNADEDESTSQDFPEATVKEEAAREAEETTVAPADPPQKKRTSKASKSKEVSEEDELFTMLKEKVLNHGKQEDEDKLFMLSLVPELRRIPESGKLDVKIELINVFKRARLQYYDPLNVAPESEHTKHFYGLVQSSCNQETDNAEEEDEEESLERD